MYRDPFYPDYKPNPSYPSAPNVFPAIGQWQSQSNHSPYINPAIQPPNYPQTMPNSLPYHSQPYDSPTGMSQMEQTPSGNNFLEYFYDANGQLDIDKMLTTVGQVASIYHQVSPIIKQFGSFMKNFTASRD